jgi:hypothetical protein
MRRRWPIGSISWAQRLAGIVAAGLPDMARMAAAGSAEHRALGLLEAMDAVGAARRLPRPRIASLAEQVRMHTGRYRSQSCREL